MELDTPDSEEQDIVYEIERNGVLHEFTLSSAASFRTFLCSTAKVFAVSITHLGALGYVPSFLPKSPKPLPKILDSDSTYEKMLEKIEDHVEHMKSRNKGKGIVKAFSIRLVDTSAGSGDGNGKKETAGKKVSRRLCFIDSMD